MSFQLVVVRGRSSAAAHRIGSGVTVAGRQDGCQLVIRSSQVSRRHCEIVESDGRLAVRDLGSANGTFVNDERVEGRRELKVGDELMIGDIKFRVETAGEKAEGHAAAAGDSAVAEPVVVSEVLVEDDDDDAVALDIGDDEQTSAPTAPTVRAPKAKPGPEPTELGEEAVADFLLNIDLDDEDKT
jgi:pSer/pThr/pTyr-binding forkhead associated (FHA) protein